MQERKQLRMARFGKGPQAKAGGGNTPATTVEALQQFEEEKKKRMERAERFGIVTKEMAQQKMKERQERFGIETKDSIESKKQERIKRFAMMESAAQEGLSAEDIERKRKERMERFGKTEVEEALQQASEGTSQLKDRRRMKLTKKLKNKQGGQQQ